MEVESYDAPKTFLTFMNKIVIIMRLITILKVSNLYVNMEI
jgi:hypothetical protein